MSKGVNICNANLSTMDVDVLYHFGLATDTSDFKRQFGDVKVSFILSCKVQV